MISTLQVCGQHLSRTKHGVRPEFVERGWEKFVDDFVMPEVEWGCRRVLLHMPFSAQADTYQFDQWIHAKNDGLITTVNFVPTMRRLRALGVEPIIYTGTLSSDRNFDKLRGLYKGDNYGRRIIDSIAPMLDAGCSIAFDYANVYKVGTVEYESIDWGRALCVDSGGRAYIEPAPGKANPHMIGWDSLTQYRWYHDHPDWWAPTKSEVILWVDQGAEAFDGVLLAEKFTEIRAAGQTPAGITAYLRQAGFKASDFQ